MTDYKDTTGQRSKASLKITNNNELKRRKKKPREDNAGSETSTDSSIHDPLFDSQPRPTKTGSGKFRCLTVGGLNISHRRLVSEVFILFLAMLAFMVASHFSPTILYRVTHKGAAPILKDGGMRVRTRPRRIIQQTHEPYIGHPYYVTDDLMELIFNADGCPGSIPPLVSRSQSLNEGQSAVVDSPMTYMNYIYHQQGPVHSRVKDDRAPNVSSAPPSPKTRYDALFIVCSNVQKSTNRDYFRQIYGNVSNTWPYKVKVVFLVGRPKTDDIFHNVSMEASQYSDIVMGNFLDHYDNLTYKTIMGFRWVHAHCRGLDLVLKLDDDVFVDVYKFFDVFRPLVKKQQRNINCFLNKKPRVHRVGKYKVYKTEFDGQFYPPFCSGFFIVPTPDVIDKYVSLYRDIRFFRLEDVFSYGVLRQAMIDVQLIHTDLVTVEVHEFMNCVLRYKYRCKYLAAQVDYRSLPVLMEQMAQFRKDMGLIGTQTSDGEA